MNLTTHTSWRLVKAIAVAIGVAALAVPVAQATLTPAGNHRSAPSVPLITEHSAGQNYVGVIHRSGPSVPLITEHSAGQNHVGEASTAGRYGPLDPGFAAAIRNHSRTSTDVSKSAAVSVPVAAPDGFDWGDAGIGAGFTFATMLLTLGGATLMLRRNRTRIAGV